MAGSTLGLSGGANNFGVGGRAGYAVGIDTFQNPDDPVAPSLVVMDTLVPTYLARSPLPNIRDGLGHTLRVRVANGKVSVWIDAVSYLFDFPLPSATPVTGHWGFAGATGGLAAVHAVKGITMSFPNGQGCVP